MQVAANTVVSFHYVLTDAANGETVDSSRERGEALTILAGRGQLIPGVEKGLEGKVVGDRFVLVITPEDGYGHRNEEAVQRLSKKFFPNADRLREGDAVVLQTKYGPQQVRVVKVGGSVVDVDTNHPLAGVTLNFDIEITDVRAATEEELAHGHAHGPGGHHHH